MKILFDECFSREGARVLGELLSLFDPPIHSEFLVDHLGTQGALDGDWGYAIDKGWIVISRDLGRSKKNRAKGPPLKLVLPRALVTSVFLRGGLGNASRFEMVRAVACVLDDIIAIGSRADQGARFSVSKTRGVFKFEAWSVSKEENKQHKS